MKAIKIIIGIIVIFALCYGAYMIFFHHPEEVKAIMEENEKGKEIFESKIAIYEAEAVRLEKEIKDQDIKVSNAETKYSTAEIARLGWKEKYEKLKQSKPVKDLKDFEDCKIEYAKLELKLGKCEIGIEKTESSLKTCHILTLELEEQKENWIEKFANIEAESKDQEIELIRRDATIKALEKVTSKINLKKAVIYTATIFAGIKLIQIGIKLLQIIFSK